MCFVFCYTQNRYGYQPSEWKMLLNELKKHMIQRHWELLSKMPFASLMDIEPVIQEKVILDAFMQLYDKCNNRSKISETWLSFKAEDVALFSGLHCNGIVVDFKRQKTYNAFKEKYLRKKTLTNIHIVYKGTF